MIARRRLLALALVAGLSACAAPPRIGGDTAAFERTGRFAVNLQPFSGSAQAVQGGFSWSDDGRTLRLNLSNPLGNTLARIQVEPAHSVLMRADGSRERARDPDALVALVWGHPMPVTGLRAWVRGQPASGPAARSVERDADDHLVALTQDGWDIRLSDYDAQGPRRIRLSRRDAQGQWRLQLRVDAP